MGRMADNTLCSVTTLRVEKISADERLDSEASQAFYHSGGDSLKSAQWMEQGAQLEQATSRRIKELEDELMQYRCMLDKMVQQRTAQLNRRVAILESCNSTLGENCHQMYLELLDKTKACEAAMDKREIV